MKNFKFILLTSLIITFLMIIILSEKNNFIPKSKELKQENMENLKSFAENTAILPSTEVLEEDFSFYPENLRKFLEKPNEINADDIRVLKYLSYEEREILYNWLAKAETNDAMQLFYKDMLLNKLEAQTNFPQEHIGKLLNFLENKTLDSDFRGYVIQHLRLHFDKANEKEKSKIVANFVEVLAEIENETAGTALLALADLSQKEFISLPQETKIAVENILEKGALRNQVTSLAVAGDLKMKDLQEKIWKILEKGPTNTTLKLAAIGALAKMDIGEELRKVGNLESVKNSSNFKHYEAAVKRNLRENK